MEKIKELLKKISDSYVTFLKNYLMTNILIYISTILTIIFVNKDIALDLFKYEIFFIANSFTVENYIKNKKSRIVGYIIAYIISAVLGFLFNNYEDQFGNFFIFYLISIPSINLVHIIKELKLGFHEYLHQIFSNLLTTTIINIVLTIGVFSVLGIINALLLPDVDFDLYLRVEIAILGFYTVPAYLYAYINKDSKISDLANNLLKYVIIPLTYIAVLVVYLYICKIFITHNMPSNSVFGIIFALFIEAIPIFILVENLNFKNKVLAFINKNISFIFIPLYLLQAYSIIIRVSIYGLTKERYLGLMALVIEAIILFLMQFKGRKYLINVFYAFIVASLITFLIPGINYEDASINYHVKVIDGILKEKKIADLNGEELAKVSASYEYLKGENALNKLSVEIKDNEVKIIEPYNNGRSYFYESFHSQTEVIDISKYSKMRTKFFDKSNIDSNKVKIDEFEIDLSDAFEKLLNHEEIKELIYKLDENNDFYVTDLDINGSNGEVTFYSIEGYILTK